MILSRDLAISLRQTLCDWFRTVQLYRMGPGISDQQMEEAWREIGHHFANLRSWESAKEYYEKSHYIEGLMDSLYYLEQYEELENCINKLPEKSPLLGKLGEMLSSVGELIILIVLKHINLIRLIVLGMCDQAVQAFLKMGDIKAAVNTCVNLRQWGQAVELAQKFKMPQIGALLDNHASQLLKDGRLPEAIELQKKAARHLDAARLMAKLAEGEITKKASHLRIKQLFVLAGLLAEDYLKSQVSITNAIRTVILAQLNPEDSTLIEQIWHSAEAYHFMLLAQRQIRNGLMHSSVLTSLRLREYEDVLNVEDIYSLLALTSCADRSFGKLVNLFEKLKTFNFIIFRNLFQSIHQTGVFRFSSRNPSNGIRRVGS